MKKPKNLKMPKRLWLALESLPTLAAVKAEWSNLLGDELQFIEKLLQPQPLLATSYPRLDQSGGGLPLRVIDHGNGDFVGACEETGETVTLRRDDLIVYVLDRRAFAAALVSALKLSPVQFQPGLTSSPFAVGQTTSTLGARFLVVFASPSDSAELDANATRWISEQPEPFLFLTPTRRFWSTSTEQTVRTNRCELLSLQDSIAVDSKGTWIGQPQAIQQLSAFGVPATADEALSDRAQLVLVAMLELGATDSDSRKSTEEIATRAIGAQADANALKNVMADLNARQLIQTKTGRRGGCWLMEKGQTRAVKLRSQ